VLAVDENGCRCPSFFRKIEGKVLEIKRKLWYTVSCKFVAFCV
jgi:hypothetical protein